MVYESKSFDLDEHLTCLQLLPNNLLHHFASVKITCHIRVKILTKLIAVMYLVLARALIGSSMHG
jgi:hypothetical protein